MEEHLRQLYEVYSKFWPEISDEEFSRIASYQELKHFKKGEILSQPGEICDWLGFINKGVVRHYHAVDGKEHVGEIYVAGQIVSDYCSYTLQDQSVIYIDVIRECEMLVIKRSDMEMLKQTMPGVLKFVAGYLARTYIANFQRNSSLLLDSAETRYLKLLRERPEILREVPLYMVASFIGITPEALSRIRNKIAHSGS